VLAYVRSELLLHLKHSVQFNSVAIMSNCFEPIDCSMPGFPVHRQFPPCYLFLYPNPQPKLTPQKGSQGHRYSLLHSPFPSKSAEKPGSGMFTDVIWQRRTWRKMEIRLDVEDIQSRSQVCLICLNPQHPEQSP